MLDMEEIQTDVMKREVAFERELAKNSLYQTCAEEYRTLSMMNRRYANGSTNSRSVNNKARSVFPYLT